MNTLFYSYIDMKRILCHLGFLTCLLSACHNDVLSPDSSTPSLRTDSCLQVFQFTTPALPAESSRSAEDSGISEPGTEEECQLSSVKVYLFDAQSKLREKIIHITQLERSIHTQEGYVTYLSKPVAIAAGTYDIFAVANCDAAPDATTETDLLASIDKTTYASGLTNGTEKGLVMSNRASSLLNVNLDVVEPDDEPIVIDIHLERVVARIDLARNADSYPVKTPEGQTYAHVALTGYHLMNLPTCYYFFRHTAVLTDLTEPDWQTESNFGEIAHENGYAIDPYFFHKPVDATGFHNPDAYYTHFSGDTGDGTSLSWQTFYPVQDPLQYKTCYSLENCTLAPAQKRGYSTGVLFQGGFLPNDNVYKLTSSKQLEKIAPDAYPDQLYYYNYGFYTSIGALEKAGANITTDTPEEDLEFYNVKHFSRQDGYYRCYYSYWLKHLDNNAPNKMGVMEFAIVRNNLYRLLVTEISELGTSTPTIDPDTPDEGITYIKAILNVQPWIIRDQTHIIL